jgi:bifunctional DNA-binding transcriptional regulator/antitoxin component of YhaV-PrlF toxin-antitoxin module
MMETTELDASEIELRERGQLTLPKSLRDALHLETGDALRAVRFANAIVLKRAAAATHFVTGDERLLAEMRAAKSRLPQALTPREMVEALLTQSQY